MTLIRSVSGIRGISGKDLHPENIAHFATMFSRFIKKGTVVCGRDTRLSGIAFNNIFSSTLNFAGINTIDCGIVPTPTVLFLVKEFMHNGGYIITASHNPPKYNGLKLVSSKGKFLNRTEHKTFSSFENSLPIIAKTQGQYIYNPELFKKHIQAVINHPLINKKLIKKRKLKVVFDGANGGGSIVISALLKALGVELIEINTNIDGKFTRELEPIPINLTGLKKAVKKHKADIGLATDGDGDRIAIVTPKRGCVSEEYTIALTADYVSKSSAGNNVIVINQSTSRMLEITGKKHHYKVKRASVGEANVVDLIIRSHALIGGEGNGGVILPDINNTRDALVASALILMMMADYRKSIDDIIDEFPVLYMKKMKFPISNDEIFKNIRKEFKDSILTETDGLRFNMDNGFLHIRKSGTEPIIRVIGEFDSMKKLQSVFNQIKRIIKCVE